jgi:hypothetical protein
MNMMSPLFAPVNHVVGAVGPRLGLGMLDHYLS